MTFKNIKHLLRADDCINQAHFQRIHGAVAESVASSEIHLELMDCYRRISSYSTNVGRAIISKDRFGDSDYELDA